MPDIQWMIPILGQGSGANVTEPIPTGFPGASLHADWNFAPFPPTAFFEGAVVHSQSSFATFPSLIVLKDTYGSWKWQTVYCGNTPSVGAQLTVSVPFSRFFDIWPPTEAVPTAYHIQAYRTIEAWIKYRVGQVGQPLNLSSISTILSDNRSMGGPNIFQYNRPYLPLTAPGFWNVAYLTKTFTAGEDMFWDNRNLRFNTVFQGPLTGGPVPTDTEVDVEWIAIALTELYIITP